MARKKESAASAIGRMASSIAEELRRKRLEKEERESNDRSDDRAERAIAVQEGYLERSLAEDRRTRGVEASAKAEAEDKKRSDYWSAFAEKITPESNMKANEYQKRMVGEYGKTIGGSMADEKNRQIAGATSPGAMGQAWSKMNEDMIGLIESDRALARKRAERDEERAYKESQKDKASKDTPETTNVDPEKLKIFRRVKSNLMQKADAVLGPTYSEEQATQRAIEAAGFTEEEVRELSGAPPYAQPMESSVEKVQTVPEPVSATYQEIVDMLERGEEPSPEQYEPLSDEEFEQLYLKYGKK